MNIMIDYDGTFGAAPSDWMDTIDLMGNRGHKFYLVTSRGKDTPVEHEEYFRMMDIPVIYCEYLAKKDVCNKLGIKIDVWIDDNPYYIDHGFITDDVPLTLLKTIEKDYR
jgi:hypothetical protein